MDTSADATPLLLNAKDEAILQAMAYYRFMTALDVTHLFFAKGSKTYARSRLSALAGGKDHQTNQYLYRFCLPSERGNSERIWTLGTKGREHLASLGASVTWQFRPEKLRHVSFAQISHTLLLTRFLVAARLWSKNHPDFALRELRICYEMQEETKAVIPDGWLLFECTNGQNYALLLELDRGMEQGQKFREHVKGRLELIRSGEYQRLFGVPSVVVTYATTGQTPEYRQTRVRAMNTWTRQVLEEAKLASWAGVFRFSAIEFDSLYAEANSLFEEAVWLRPDTKEKVRLFE